MYERKLNEFGAAIFETIKENYKQAEDIRSVFEYDCFGMGECDGSSSYVTECKYEVNNTIYANSPYEKLIDISISDMIIEIDNTFLTMYQVDIDTDEETEIASFELAAIRKIYYRYDNSKLDLFFEVGNYLVNLVCDRFG